MDDIEHPDLIEECIKNIDAAAYEKNRYKDEKLPSIKKKIDRNDKTEYWPKIIKESLHWLLFYIIEFTTDRIENDKNLLPSLLVFFQYLRLNFGEIRGKMIKKQQ